MEGEEKTNTGREPTRFSLSDADIKKKTESFLKK